MDYGTIADAWRTWRAAAGCFGGSLPRNLPDVTSAEEIIPAVLEAGRRARIEHEARDERAAELGPDPSPISLEIGAYGLHSLTYGSGRTYARLHVHAAGYGVEVGCHPTYAEEECADSLDARRAAAELAERST